MITFSQVKCSLKYIYEEDVRQAAAEIAQQQGVSIGKVVSDLARQTQARQQSRTQRNGVPLFPIQPTAGIVKSLRSKSKVKSQKSKVRTP